MNNVESLDLTCFLKPSLKDKYYPKKEDKPQKPLDELVEWKELSPMMCERSNFAAFISGNYIYVYGGIKGKQIDPAKSNYKPIMATPICERYDIIKDIWEEYKIIEALPIACFGYVMKSEFEMITVGGTDG